MSYKDEKETKAGSKASKRAKNKGYTSEGTTKTRKTKPIVNFEMILAITESTRLFATIEEYHGVHPRVKKL